MNKLLSCLLAALGLTASCGAQGYDEADVAEFARLLDQPGVIVVDVRTAEEYAEGHIDGAINIDQGQPDLIDQARATLPAGRRLAVYCRSGRRSASAAARLAAEGYRCTNLRGGIIAWSDADQPTTTDRYEVDVFRTPGGKTVRLHALMHASIRIEYDGREIEADPVRQLGGRTVDYAALPKADYILVTHEHGDHFDPGAIALLSAGQTRTVVNRRCADMLGAGDTAGDGKPAADSDAPAADTAPAHGHLLTLANGDKLTLADDISVEAVPAYNTTEDREQFHPKGRDNGYILTLDGLRIYIAGDTEDIDEMAAIEAIDIAFLPCNQPYTMTPTQLIHAAQMIRPKVLFPYHYGQTDVTGIAAHLDAAVTETRIRHYE